MALSLNVINTIGHARACDLILPHGSVRTPVFMPVGTKGTIKGVVLGFIIFTCDYFVLVICRIVNCTT